jgi:hypothetical protein
MLNHFDIAFIVDTTASMGSFIRVAQKEMKDTLSMLSKQRNIDMRVAVVEYRDHPPQDFSFVTKVHDFTDDLDTIQKVIDQLTPQGGGDLPEAVFDGVVAACKLEWREHARRLAVLLGDAPPHGYTHGNRPPATTCPCGETTETVTSLVEETSIRLFSIPLSMNASLIESFKELSLLTGGGSFPAGRGSTAITEISRIIKEEFGNLTLDEQVWTNWHETHGEISANKLSKKLDTSLDAIYDSLGRLGVRKLLDTPTAIVDKSMQSL